MDEQTRIDLERILSVYREQELREKPLDESGLWKPTPLSILLGEIKALDVWYAKEGEKHVGKVLVAGSGDGRRVVCLNRFGYDVIGFEINPELVRTSNYLIDFLEQQGLIDKNRIRVVKGSFLDDDLYLANGLRFEDFPKIFTYLRKHDFERLVQKIELQSPQGTELFTLRPVEWETPKIGLEHLSTATIRGDTITPHYEISRYRKK